LCVCERERETKEKMREGENEKTQRREGTDVYFHSEAAPLFDKFCEDLFSIGSQIYFPPILPVSFCERKKERENLSVN